MPYSNRIKAYRALNRIKQEEIANLLNVTLTTYANKENGKVEFTLSEAKKIAEHFKLSIDELFFKNEVNFMNTNK